MPNLDRLTALNWEPTMMTLSVGSQLPRELLQGALAHWDEISSQLIERLRAFSAGRRDRVSDAEAFFIVHLCAEKRETRAYPILCAMIAGDPRIADWLDDAVTETLPGILINVFDGDVGVLLDAIEAESGDAFARASALAALGYLVRARGVLSEEDMKAYLWRIWREAHPRGESVLWLVWASTAAALGYEDLHFAVLWLAREGFVPERCFGVEEFNRRAAVACADPDGLDGFPVARPLDDAVAALEFLFGLDAMFEIKRASSRATARPDVAGPAFFLPASLIAAPAASGRLRLIRGGRA